MVVRPVFTHPWEVLPAEAREIQRSSGGRLIEILVSQGRVTHRQVAETISRRLGIPMLEVPYEALVADQEPWSRRIIEFCGLDWDESCLRYYERANAAHTLSYDQVRRPIYTSSVGRARHFERHLDPLRESLGAADDDK